MRSIGMDRLATKTRSEREDEEVERLVRPSPKVKPPRHDRRRERVKTEKDPDLDTTDKDLSMNYKVIGGSVHTAKNSDLITVRLKDDPSRVVQVTKETLRSQPHKYEEVVRDDEPAAPEKPSAPEKTKPKGKPSKTPSEPEIAKAQKALRDMAKADAEFAAILQDFKNPRSDIFQWAKSRPETPVSQFLRGRTPPKGIETMGDLQQVLLYKPTKAPEVTVPSAGPGQDEPKPPAAKPEPTPSQEKTPEEPKTPEKAPEPPAKGPPDRPSTPPGGKPGKGPKPKPLTPQPPQRSVTKSETAEAQMQLVRTFPTEVAVDLLLVRPKLHPDEVNKLVGDFHLARSVPVKLNEIDKLQKDAASFYTMDPNSVKPPKTVSKNGEEVPFKSLSEQEQAQAWRQHQVQTLAMSLAARDAIKTSLEAKAGAPKDLADNLAHFMLSGQNEAPDARQKRASKEAEVLFYKGLEDASDSKPIAPGTIQKVLGAIKDPATQKVAVGYFQSRDYNEARKQFLDPGSESHISERQSPDVIAHRLASAMEFLRERAERYPEGLADDTAATFRARVMRHLGALAPDKQPLIQELLDEEDNRYYDKAVQKYEQSREAYEKERKQAESEFEQDYKAYSERLKAGETDLDPPLSSRDRLAAKGVLEPREPVRPAHYDLRRKSPQDLAETASNLWETFKGRVARDRTLAAKVAMRSILGPFSTYLDTSAMDRNRQAVYWGVEPEKVEAYPGWTQPQARDLGEKDFSRLLTAAREWLKAPVLSESIDGIERDTQLRAALDLAIQTEGYKQTIHPGVYDRLLTRLAGGSKKAEDERSAASKVVARSKETARNTMPNDKVAFEKSVTDRLLARLDRVASTVQANHQKWGMSFDSAKSLVNEIDRIADELEKAAYGEESMTVRQAQIITGTDKTAEVLQRDSDEPYMDTFKNPSKPHQTEADEPYMKAYGDDDSSGVHHGKSSTGRPLA